AVEGVAAPTGDEQVRPAIVVVVADGNSVPVAAGKPGDPRGVGGVFERAVAPIVEEPVTTRGTGILAVTIPSLEGRGTGRERPAWATVDTDPAVAVVVEEAPPAAHQTGDLGEGGRAVVEREPEARSLSVVAELKPRRATCRRLIRGPARRIGPPS